ncbi:hypothetical protein TRFO_03353 [Tritrichomonas foetus]|uniref:non-specific serine/threonine protein kinase n=1 Tax=Tritrichomonas foetus TaxID=1144522 RepID=A0A1J4KV16_9EUKA|nr:hypothetical protein TRFO_03353 [Tritrichomonas foetus]|eukprot:OHT13588.1 hypothetical protein TRFO_03353 [Tritrichomonas foetus]
MSIFANLLGVGNKDDDKKVSISGPMEVTHTMHIDTNLNWSFDTTVDPKTIFTKLKVLGKGGFGTVLQIVHRPSMKVLAGKLINPNLVDENSKQEIEHEIELMRAVDSDYTVHYYGCIMFEGSLMILMEYCDRGSLRDLLDAREQVLSEDQISIVLHDLLKGLQIIHKRNRIVHRDIKAANILITTDCEIKIADFGVSRQFDAGACQTMTIVGTPYWMAPEVISGTSYSFPADIWSVGITAVELAEGAPPYIEFAPTKAMIEIAIKGFPGYRFPTMHSPDFVDFVSKCLIVNQHERWNVDQLLEHPFIQRAERMPRAQVLRDLLKPTKSRGRRDSMDYSTLSTNNPISGLPQSVPQTNDSTFQMNSSVLSYADNVNLPTGRNFANSEFDGNSFSGMAMMMSQRFEPGTFKLPVGNQIMGGNSGDSLSSFNLPLGQNPFDSLQFASFKPGENYEFADSTFVASSSPLDSLTADSTFVATSSPLDSLTADSTFVATSSPLETADSTFVASSSPLSQVNSVNNTSVQQTQQQFQQQGVPMQTFNPNVAGGVSDLVFVKAARAMSLKIPFIPMKTAVNNTLDVSTLYTTGKNMALPESREQPLFDEEGVLNLSRALRERRAPPILASVMLMIVFLSFGNEGFLVLATFAFITNLLVVYYRKQRKQIIKNIEEGSDDGPIN